MTRDMVKEGLEKDRVAKSYGGKNFK